ncbi:MAG: hypothetical protein JWR69_3156 [Pedosphaera sp.]|nr:hypothetical protein [Pedosphaera sp.]
MIVFLRRSIRREFLLLDIERHQVHDLLVPPILPMRKHCFAFALAVALSAANGSAQTTFQASLTGAGQTPANASTATGVGTVVLNAAQNQITVNLSWTGLSAPASAAHIHGPGGVGTNASVLFPFSGVPAATSGAIPQQVFSITATQVGYLNAGYLYFNVHNSTFPGGEIRGQALPATYNLMVTTNGNGSISPGSGTYTAGSNVVLTATPNPGYAFTNWSGAVTGTNNPISVSMTGDKAVTGNFVFATNSVPASIALAAQIGWFATTNFHYQVQAADVLNSNVWFDLGGPIAGNNATNFSYDPFGTNQKRFYRVMTRP